MASDAGTFASGIANNDRCEPRPVIVHAFVSTAGAIVALLWKSGTLPQPRIAAPARSPRNGARSATRSPVPSSTTTLWRPVGERELELVQASDWRRFPPRLTGQPIFYPVLNEDYATMIARDWNTKDAASGYVGHVLRFDVEISYFAQFPPRRVGGAGIDELWIPAERLDEFNDHIIGPIALVSTYRGDASA